jgi:hypothetical protein
MYLVEPITITTAKLIHTDIAAEYAEYVAGTTYAIDEYVVVAADYKVYKSLQNANTGHTPSASPTWWVDCGYMNKWRPFDKKVQQQASQAATMQWVMEPGGTVDAVSVINADVDTLRILAGNTADELLSNGTAWTGAVGTTPPTGWTLDGIANDFAIDSGWLRITSGGSGYNGCYQAENVTAGHVMQLCLKYKNTVGDVAQYGIYDVTHSSWIKAVTSLTDSQTEATASHVFTVPAGCTSVRIYIRTYTINEIVWFDNVSLLRMVYDSGSVSMTNATSLTKSDVTSYALPRITVIAAKSTTAYVGEIITGAQYEVGTSLGIPGIEFKDYSTKEADSFGNYTITERDYDDILECRIKILSSSIDAKRTKVLSYRATPAVWIFSSTYSMTQIYGYCDRFSVPLRDQGSALDWSDCTLRIQGLT